jgi:hypothetical protein
MRARVYGMSPPVSSTDLQFLEIAFKKGRDTSTYIILYTNVVGAVDR